MPDIDLPPAEYQDRKPKGWRWKLPWSHPDDNKLALVMGFVAIGFAGYFFINMGASPSPWVVGAIAMMSAGAGAMLMLALRD